MRTEMPRLGKGFLLAVAIALLLSSIIPVIALENEGYTLSENYALRKETFVSESNGETAVDGDSLTRWRTSSGSKNNFAYLIVSLGQKTAINLLQVRVLRPEQMTAVRLQYTTASDPQATSDWIDIKTWEGNDIPALLTVGFETVEATAVRFYADVRLHRVGIRELAVYHTDNIEAAVADMTQHAYLPYEQSESVNAQIVSVGENGELVYADYDGQGSKLLDYSRVGYRAGEEEIPLVKVVKILEPGNLTDHTSMIRKAINEVAALPEDQRGAILLRAGTYTVSGQINITASGIVLRGEGQGENGTVIYDKRTNVGEGSITVSIKGNSSYTVVNGTKRAVQNSLIPMGQTEMTLPNVTGYAVGDTVQVVCTPNEHWVKALGMNVLPGDSVQWKPSEYIMKYERVIVAVDEASGTVTLDTGIPLTLDQTYYSTAIQKIKDSKNRITECGIENIRFLSTYNGNYEDEKHAWTAVKLQNCRNCWVRDVTAKHYAYACVEVSDKSIHVTVEGCSFLDPRSKVDGSRRYSFCLNGGQYTLFRNCYARDSRHDYVVQNMVCGPNVFLDCVADESNAVSEPHHRWSNGTLYDHVYQIGAVNMSYLAAMNRGKSGSGHGWAGANTVFWNCLSPAIIVGKPQTEQNFAVGAYGIYDVSKSQYLSNYKKWFVVPEIEIAPYPENKDYENSPMHGTGYIESPYNPVNPSSLYFAQLSYRLYGDATKNVAPTAPILQYPAADSKSDSYSVILSGAHDLGADRVYVYVDGGKYEAKLAEDGSNTFSLTLYLPNGYHEVFVTQVADGMESARGAARTFLVEAQGTYDASAAVKPEMTINPDYPIIENEPTTETNKPETNKPETNSGEPTTDNGVVSADGTEPGEPNDTDSKPVDGNDPTGTILIAVGIAIAACVAVGASVICMRKKKQA